MDPKVGSVHPKAYGLDGEIMEERVETSLRAAPRLFRLKLSSCCSRKLG
jgi:hypothetical protein